MLKILCCGLTLLVILMEQKLLELFTKKILQKTNHKEFRIEKVIKENDGKLYVKWKEYNNLFNSSVEKKYII